METRETWIFLHLGKQSVTLIGPIALDQLKLEISSHRLSFADLVYVPGEGWKRIYAVEELRAILPALPNDRELDHFERKAKTALPSSEDPTVIQDVSSPSLGLEKASRTSVEPAPPVEKVKIDPNDRSTWFLQFEGSEFGPFTVLELGKILDSGKLKGNLYAWKKGLQTWLPVSNLSQLYRDIQNKSEDFSNALVEKGSNLRTHARTSLVATVSCTVNKVAHVIGVCSDVSEGGMQVLNSSGLDFKKGEKIELTINPIGATGIAPFSVQGRVAWISKNPQKVGLQFVDGSVYKDLKEYIRKAIDIFKS